MKMPSLLVFVVYCTPVTSLTTTTSAAAMTPLDGSCTDPLIFPLGDCATTGRINAKPHAKTRTQPERCILLSSKQRISGTHPLIHGTMSGATDRENYFMTNPSERERERPLTDDSDSVSGRQTERTCRWVCGCHHWVPR